MFVLLIIKSILQAFQFKQFTITQDGAAMKVGTDGVLLGAWAIIKGANALDIGTGTGLIALMLAQRNQPILIDAVEIEKEAYNQASKNVKKSKFSDRINVHNSSIQNYNFIKKYDTIVSNPPFFLASTKSHNTKRTIARHTDSLSYSDLVCFVVGALKLEGVFSIILPINEAKKFIKLAEKQHLFLIKECIVKPNPIKPAKRVLMAFSFQKSALIKEVLTLETGTRHSYTKKYKALTQDFYLKF